MSPLTIGLIIGGILLVAAGLGVGLFFILRKKKTSTTNATSGNVVSAGGNVGTFGFGYVKVGSVVTVASALITGTAVNDVMTMAEAIPTAYLPIINRNVYISTATKDYRLVFTTTGSVLLQNADGTNLTSGVYSISAATFTYTVDSSLSVTKIGNIVTGTSSPLVIGSVTARFSLASGTVTALITKFSGTGNGSAAYGMLTIPESAYRPSANRSLTAAGVYNGVAGNFPLTMQTTGNIAIAAPGGAALANSATFSVTPVALTYTI